MEVSTAISMLALVLSATSLAFTAYNIIRDKGRLCVWSEVYYDRSRDPDDPPPGIKIRMVNVGRRPIVIASLVKISRSETWSSPLKLPDLPTDNDGNLIRLPTVVDLPSQYTSVLLQEGCIYEIAIEYDREHDLISLEGGKAEYAEKLCIEDVLGNRYYVEHSKESIPRRAFEG